MQLQELHHWIVSDRGLRPHLDLVARACAAHEFNSLQAEDDLDPSHLDWQRLLLAASTLSVSADRELQEAALRVAYAGLSMVDSEGIRDACAVILSQMSNGRSVDLAVRRGLLRDAPETRLGPASAVLAAKREFRDMVLLRDGSYLPTNRFQREFWIKAGSVQWLSATAPTASGKTYIVLRWLLDRLGSGQDKLVIYLAPTRALVAEIEAEVRALARQQGMKGIRVSSMPLKELYDRQHPTVLVLTQERLHLFANAVDGALIADVVVIDEAQKMGDNLRGVILQDAVERLARANPKIRAVFLSPSSENPGVLVADAPAAASTDVVPSDDPTVTQNLIYATQKPRDPKTWQLDLNLGGRSLPIGTVHLPSTPDNLRKRTAYIAAALGDGTVGTLVYANGADEAEKIAWQIYSSIAEDPALAADEELTALAELAQTDVHEHFALAILVRRGVAFHYGNMPALLRGEIERLFREGKIRFLVCTSTLIEGVNLACRTIVVRGPTKGKGRPMEPQDFWNLAGRAGRWGREFQGNIICVDATNPKVWPDGPPRRTRFSVHRQTDTVLGDRKTLLPFLQRRWEATDFARTPHLEYVGAYLLALHMREGSIVNAPWTSRFDEAYVEELDRVIGMLAERIEVPAELVGRHPGVSAVSLQRLLEYFRNRKKPVEDLVPATPESDDAYASLIAVFKRINAHLYPAFFPAGAIPVHALVTLDWMRGHPLARIIGSRERYLREKGKAYNIHAVIRATMQDVEQVARFIVPKFLGCYLDVLRYHLNEMGRPDLIPAARFDLFLEFGVGTRTLISLIGLGLSRTTALALNEYITRDDLDEAGCLEWIASNDLEKFDIPALVRREAAMLIVNRTDETLD